MQYDANVEKYTEIVKSETMLDRYTFEWIVQFTYICNQYDDVIA